MCVVGPCADAGAAVGAAVGVNASIATDASVVVLLGLMVAGVCWCRRMSPYRVDCTSLGFALAC